MTPAELDDQRVKQVAHRQIGRVTLAQLLLWMFAIAVVLAHQEWRFATGENQHELFLSYSKIHLLVFSPLYGACLAGLLLCVWRVVVRGPRFPTEPGHWFLVIAGIRLVVYGGFDAVVNAWLLKDQTEAMPAGFWRWIVVGFGGLYLCLALLAAVLTRGGNRGHHGLLSHAHCIRDRNPARKLG
jgi:hypothetical protein